MPLVCATCLREATEDARVCPNPDCVSDQPDFVKSLIGRILDQRYRVERLLGVGAMGEIWQATHVHTGQPRAIKILAPAANDEAATNRFLHELRATALADNAHTATVFEAGPLGDGRLYLALELVDGRTLEEDMATRRVANRDSTWRRVAHIASQICASLDCAHRVGVVHRDLKPANVMLAPRDGDPLFTKVLDFGIATITAVSGTSGAVGQGLVAGTPEYMSPEQLHGGKEIDHRTDLYSLGVLMYEMLAGVPPLTGPTPLDIARARHKKAAPSVRAIRPDIPGALDQLMLELLAKEPSDRPPSAAAVRERLRQLLGMPRTGASGIARANFRTTEVRPRVLARRIRGLRGVAAAIAAVLVTATAVWGISVWLDGNEADQAPRAASPGPAPVSKKKPPSEPPEQPDRKDGVAVGLSEGAPSATAEP